MSIVDAQKTVPGVCDSKGKQTDSLTIPAFQNVENNMLSAPYLSPALLLLYFSFPPFCPKG